MSKSVLNLALNMTEGRCSKRKRRRIGDGPSDPQRFLEVDIHRLVAWCIRIRNVRCKKLLTIDAEPKRFFVKIVIDRPCCASGQGEMSILVQRRGDVIPGNTG